MRAQRREVTSLHPPSPDRSSCRVGLGVHVSRIVTDSALSLPLLSGYIDLSKRRVSAEDIEKCEEKFEKGKLVHSVLTHVAGKMEVDVELLYSQVAWPLSKRFGHAYDAFKLSIR